MKSLFGSLSRERILTFIAAREQGYAGEIIEFWKCNFITVLYNIMKNRNY
jgi:hypothetical protein